MRWTDTMKVTRDILRNDMPPQSPRDRILWILTNSGGRKERSRLRRCTEMRYADLDLTRSLKIWRKKAVSSV